MANILELRDLCVSYGAIDALKSVNISVEEGSIVALLGANGAGKTTTLRTISGVVKAKSGQILLNNEPITNRVPYKIASLGVIQSPEGRLILNGLTVEENLKVGAYGLKGKEIRVKKSDGNYETVKMSKSQLIKYNFDKVYKLFPILQERKKQQANTLSGGEQRNINIQTNPDQPEVIFAQINSTTATELASQVQLVKDCDVVIIAGNQTYFQAAYTAMQTANVRKPVITSYVNIAPATVPNEATSAEASDIYGGAWVIIDDSADERQKADLLRFIAICDWGVEKGIISRSTADSYLISAYAMSSFIALDVFMTGIDRLADKEITREAFLEAMESAPINVPISGGVNYANGQRIGLDGMSFVKYVRPTEAGAAASTGTFVNVVGMQSIDQILGELDDAE